MTEPNRADMTCNEQITAILTAMPGMAVVIYRDGQDFRAALVDRPDPHKTASTECQGYPDEAIDIMHESLVKDAEQRHAMAGEHLGRLMARIVPKHRPGPVPDKGDAT